MSAKIQAAFEMNGVVIEIDKILRLKKLTKPIRLTQRYQRIKSSVQEIGIVEPPVVYPYADSEGCYTLLDGHLRVDVVERLGNKEIFCLIATEDETFTYNHKVNQLTTIQEHYMIVKAIKNGVSEERIAQTLNIDIEKVKKKMNLLDGVCSEAIELLKSRDVSAGALRELKRVHPIRQIEMSELMIASNNYGDIYARCMVAATSQDQLVKPESRKMHGSNEKKDIARLQNEMQNLERDFKMVQDEYGQNMLKMVVVVGYLKSLMGNAAVVRYMSQIEPTMITEFQQIIENASMRPRDEMCD
tara:strand:+ start:2464 stop:3366 length:903 start_codon:yes stop_codon:yes gene_type:complete